jgi:hypothetical protein
MGDPPALRPFAWQALRYLAATSPHLLSAHVVGRGIGVTDQRARVELESAESLGLLRRRRPPGGPWGWELTEAGQAALIERIDRQADAEAGARQAEHDERAARWASETDRVLKLHIGLIDPQLCERTGRFLAREEWLIKDSLSDKMLLLVAKAVGYES